MPGQGYIHELLPLLDGWDYELITAFEGYPILVAGATRELVHFEETKAQGINGWLNTAHLSCNNPLLLVKLEVDKSVSYLSPFLVRLFGHNTLIRVTKYDVPNSIYVIESVPEVVPEAYGEKMVISIVNPTAVPITIYELYFSMLSIKNRNMFMNSLEKLIGNQPRIQELLEQIAGVPPHSKEKTR